MKAIFICILFFFAFYSNPSTKDIQRQPLAQTKLDCTKLYDEMHLDGIVNYNAFEQVIKGAEDLDVKNRDIVTLIDFSKPSSEERLYILDLRHKKLILKSYVSHGKNSGEKYATSFSNENGSFKSSLGFYLTENTYQGKNGYSLILKGLEKGINDNAKERSIVIHGASYSNASAILASGRLGRSHGCPALPPSVNAFVINTIKDGTLLYIYANNRNYMAQSSILSKRIQTL